MRWFIRSVRLRSSAECPFAWHERPGALEGLTPPWENIEVLYRLPLNPLSTALASHYVDRGLTELFGYRRENTKRDIEAACQHKARRMKILITGMTGVIGSALWPLLSTSGHTVVGLRRHDGSGSARHAWWDPETGAVDEAAIDGADAAIHLAGENIAGRRWTDAQKRRIYSSRVDATRKLCLWLAARPVHPSIFISASAMGVYGDRGDAWVDEGSDAGSGFLADLGRAWEAATAPLQESGVRVVHLRTGLVLTPRGATLGRLLLPFRLGLGGRLGDGGQYMSWIDIEDQIRAIRFVLTRGDVRGPVNLVSPNPVTNREFTATLARVLGRPALLPLPAGLLRLAFGEMADGALLASTRVRPACLQDLGFEFLYPDLEDSLRHLLGRS